METNTKFKHQMLLEHLFNKNQTISRIRAEFQDSKEVNFVGYMLENGIDENFGLDVMTQMALHKRADMQTLIGTLRHHFNTAQQVADGLLLCATHDLIDWNPETETFIVRFTISQDVQLEIDRFSYPLPMVIPPVYLESNKQSAYLGKDYSILLKNNHHEEDVCLDFINKTNRVSFRLNMDTARMVKNTWRNLDKAKEGESKEDYEKRVRAFERYDKHANEINELLVKEDNRFWFTNRYCKRGRRYCQGHHVTYQGTPWNKAIIEFYDEEVTPND